MTGGDDDPWGKRPRKAVGPERQTYFNETDVDRLMAVVLALASEVATLRERVDTHERIAGEGERPDIERVEAYRPDPAIEEAREAWRDAYIRRLFRVITEDVEALRRSNPAEANPVEANPVEANRVEE